MRPSVPLPTLSSWLPLRHAARPLHLPIFREKAELAALHHRQRKELQDSMAALRQAYDDTRAEAAAAYRLMVRCAARAGACCGSRVTMPVVWLRARPPMCVPIVGPPPAAQTPPHRWLPPPLHPPPPQEEDLHSRASEALNLTRVALEGRVKELEGALEAEHRVRWSLGAEGSVKGQGVTCLDGSLHRGAAAAAHAWHCMAYAGSTCSHLPQTQQGYVEATGEQEAAYRQLAAADAVAAEAIAQRTARLRLLQETLVQVGAWGWCGVGRQAHSHI